MSEVEEFLETVKKNIGGSHKIEAEGEGNEYVVKADGKKISVAWKKKAGEDLKKFHNIDPRTEAAKIVAIEINEYLGKK